MGQPGVGLYQSVLVQNEIGSEASRKTAVDESNDGAPTLRANELVSLTIRVQLQVWDRDPCGKDVATFSRHPQPMAANRHQVRQG